MLPVRNRRPPRGRVAFDSGVAGPPAGPAPGHSLRPQGLCWATGRPQATRIPPPWVLSPKTRCSSEMPPSGDPMSLLCLPAVLRKGLSQAGRTLGAQGKGWPETSGFGPCSVCLPRPRGVGVWLKTAHCLPRQSLPLAGPRSQLEASCPGAGRTKQRVEGGEGPPSTTRALRAEDGSGSGWDQAPPLAGCVPWTSHRTSQSSGRSPRMGMRGSMPTPGPADRSTGTIRKSRECAGKHRAQLPTHPLRPPPAPPQPGYQRPT